MKFLLSISPHQIGIKDKWDGGGKIQLWTVILNREAEDGTQDLIHAKYALYHWATSPARLKQMVLNCDPAYGSQFTILKRSNSMQLETMNNNTCFLLRFSFVQARIAKRDRKLVDYDSARHNYATTHKTKKKDGGIKITKVK